jgi:hypothetical protein
MATGLGPHIGQQAVRCETSDTLMEVFLSLHATGRGCGDSPEGWPHRLTHSHLLSANLPPVCAPCHVELCVIHILLDCPEYTVRHQWFHLPSTISDMLGDDPEILA